MSEMAFFRQFELSPKLALHRLQFRSDLQKPESPSRLCSSHKFTRRSVSLIESIQFSQKSDFIVEFTNPVDTRDNMHFASLPTRMWDNLQSFNAGLPVGSSNELLIVAFAIIVHPV